LEYESFYHLIEKDKAFKILNQNFHTDLTERTIRFGEKVYGSVQLNCSRCYSIEGKGRQIFYTSFPIYIAVLLVTTENQILCCHLVPVEPLIKKMKVDLNQIKFQHKEGIKLRFKNSLFSKLKNPFETLGELEKSFSPEIKSYAPDYCNVNEVPNFLAYGENLGEVIPPFIMFGNLSPLLNPDKKGNIISGVVPPSTVSQTVSLYLLIPNNYYHFGQFTYKDQTTYVRKYITQDNNNLPYSPNTNNLTYQYNDYYQVPVFNNNDYIINDSNEVKTEPYSNDTNNLNCNNRDQYFQNVTKNTTGNHLPVLTENREYFHFGDHQRSNNRPRNRMLGRNVNMKSVRDSYFNNDYGQNNLEI